MPATYQRLPQEPIIVVTITEPFNPIKEMASLAQGFAPIIADIEGPVYLIIDMIRWNIRFSDVVHALDVQSQDGMSSGPRLHTIVVSRSELAALGASATSQEQYGSRNTLLFGSVDEALTFSRAQPVPGQTAN